MFGWALSGHSKPGVRTHLGTDCMTLNDTNDNDTCFSGFCSFDGRLLASSDVRCPYVWLIGYMIWIVSP